MRNLNHRSLEVVISSLVIIILVPLLSGYLSRFIRKSRTAEAIHYVNQMALGARSYYLSMLELQPNLSPQFPSQIGPTPQSVACQSRIPTAFNHDLYQQLWDHPSWNALNFRIDTPFYFTYSFMSAGVGSNAFFTARAEGDLDCDAILSNYEITGSVTNDYQVYISLIRINPIINEFE